MIESIHKTCGKTKMKKKIILIIAFLLIGLITIYLITEPKVEKWIYKLPNNYAIKKTSDTDVVLGKYIKGSFSTKNNGKQIGVEEYIAEFSYGENYIALKCLETNSNSVKVNFYIIDSKNENIYGPYENEEIYNEVKEKIIDEELNEWIETINRPSGAK